MPNLTYVPDFKSHIASTYNYTFLLMIVHTSATQRLHFYATHDESKSNFSSSNSSTSELRLLECDNVQILTHFEDNVRFLAHFGFSGLT